MAVVEDKKKQEGLSNGLQIPSKLSLRVVLNPNGPWVLVPNGSMMGIFDFVPRHLRVGPWKLAAKMYVIMMTVVVIYLKPDSNMMENMDIVYPELYSAWWYYNLIVFLWMAGILSYTVLPNRIFIFATYTIQSWSYLTLRHGLTALAPFLQRVITNASTNDDSTTLTVQTAHTLLRINECLRFPSLVTATLTFVLWNFFIAPAMYYYMPTKKRRTAFVWWNFSFRMVQIHLCNMVFAVLNNISVSPRRSFQLSDLWCALVMAVMYSLFYLFVLDRLGVHLYPIFSPRSYFMVLTWSLVWGLYYGAYVCWNRVMQSDVLSFGG